MKRWTVGGTRPGQERVVYGSFRDRDLAHDFFLAMKKSHKAERIKVDLLPVKDKD